MSRKFRILLIPSGGTICTRVHGDGVIKTRSISEHAGLTLIRNYYSSDSDYINDVDITASHNFGILSENMTPDKWNILIDYFRSISSSFIGYDGIIIAHGTDTLAFSSSLFSIVLKEIGIPVFFVSSSEPLSSFSANGNDNFRAAVECICMGIQPNVYVTYKNPGENRMMLHLGSRLTQCRNYEESFYSVGGVDISSANESNCKSIFSLIPSAADKDVSLPFELSGSWKLSGCVLKIEPYVGLDYGAFDFSKFKAVLHGTYHSGTVCAERTKDMPDFGKYSILTLLDKCRGGTEVFISPAKLSGEIYESAAIVANYALSDANVHFIYGCTGEMTYAKLLLYYSIGLSCTLSADDFLRFDYTGEHIY